jgi:hypothetical protein
VDFTQEGFGVHSCVKFFVYGHIFASEFGDFLETFASAQFVLQAAFAAFQFYNITLIFPQIPAACPMLANQA